MKNILTFILISLFSLSQVVAYTQHNIQSANYIASKGIINDNSYTPINYNLDYNITRREMLKVMMNLSGKEVIDRCLWAFSDVWVNDWGCKYAEAAILEWFIATNTYFRPDDNITQIEALKMIMQAIWMKRDNNDDWRAGYVSKASREKIIDDNYLDYNKSAVRGWIFSNTARSYDDFKYVESEVEIDPEIEELFDSLFDL